MRRPGAWEESRIDLVRLTKAELRSAYDLLGPLRAGRRRRWNLYCSPLRPYRAVPDDSPGAVPWSMVRFTLWDNDLSEAMWLRFGSDPRLVDCLREHGGSPSRRFVEEYTHWLDAPFSSIEPLVRRARAELHRHHFEWGGGQDRWLLWAKTEAARTALDAWPERALLRDAPATEWDHDGGERLIYVRRVQAEARASVAA